MRPKTRQLSLCFLLFSFLSVNSHNYLDKSEELNAGLCVGVCVRFV